MKVTDISDSLSIGDVVQPSTRVPGLHLSAVIAEALRIMKGDTEEALPPKYADNEITVADYAQFLKGFLWEDAFGDYWVRRLEGSKLAGGMSAQLLLELDGILMMPDYIDFSGDDGPVVLECKATARSMLKLDALEKYFLGWLMQIMGYCHRIGTTRAVLAVLFICGDYRPPFPRVKLLALEFSQQELEENWATLTKVADIMRAEGKA